MIEVVEPGANKVISIGIFSRNIGKEITSDNYKIKAILNGYLVQLLANAVEVRPCWLNIYKTLL